MLLPIALAVLTTQSYQNEFDATLPSHIKPLGWTYYGQSNDGEAFLFYMVHQRQPIVWIRIEQPGDDLAKSGTVQYRVNCDTEVATSQKFVFYKGANLTDYDSESTDGTSDVPEPNSTLAAATAELCGFD